MKHPRSGGLGRSLAALLSVAILGTLAAGCSHATGRDDLKRPVAGEFGLGPRASQKRLYTASLEPAQPLRTRRLQTVAVRIVDASGRPVQDAVIAVDGGMPEHGHGLPTQPRVSRALGDGVYQIDGLRFSMGGWWELKLAIQASGGADNVTFNLDL